ADWLATPCTSRTPNSATATFRSPPIVGTGRGYSRYPATPTATIGKSTSSARRHGKREPMMIVLASPVMIVLSRTPPPIATVRLPMAVVDLVAAFSGGSALVTLADPLNADSGALA